MVLICRSIVRRYVADTGSRYVDAYADTETWYADEMSKVVLKKAVVSSSLLTVTPGPNYKV